MKLKNDFNIHQYLLAIGFEQMSERTYLRMKPSAKVKLIHPDETFLCGFRTAAISDPSRVFAKKEIEIPTNKGRADMWFLPLLQAKPLKDTSYINQFETQGEIKHYWLDDSGPRYIALIMANGELVDFKLSKVAHGMIKIRIGDWVHVVFTLLAGEDWPLEIISIQKV